MKKSLSVAIMLLAACCGLAAAQDSANVRTVGLCPYGMLRGIAIANIGDTIYAVFGSGGYVMIANINNPDTTVRTGEIATPGKVSNVAVSGNYAYVADNLYGLRVIDISNPANPAQTGLCSTPKCAFDVAVSGNYAYVIDTTTGLRIIDISNPATMTETAYYPMPGKPCDLVVSGNYAYVAGYAGLRIIDITNPASPVEAGHYDTSGYAQCVTVCGNYAYVGFEGIDSDMKIIDISNPATPIVVGHYPHYIYQIIIYGNYAYCNDLQIIDVSNPAMPYWVGYVRNAYAQGGMVISGNHIYALGYRIKSYDLSNPASPVRSSETRYPLWLRGVVLSGSYAFLASDYPGLLITDVSNPALPYETGGCTFNQPGATKLAVSGIYAYVPWWEANSNKDHFCVINISNPALPAVVSNNILSHGAHSLVVTGNYAYIASDSLGLVIIDISNPVNPTRVGRCNLADVCYNVTVSGNYAYVANRNGLRIIDVSNPALPCVVGYSNTPSHANGVAVSGAYAYVADTFSGLWILDISNPAAPVETGYCSTPGQALDVAVSGEYVYVADGESGLRIIKTSTLYTPIEVGHYDTPGNACDVAVSGNNIYVADENGGLRIYQGYGLAGITNDEGRITNEEATGTTLRVYGNCIEYTLGQADNVCLTLYNLLGQEVRTLVNGFQVSGSHVSRWDGRDGRGRRAASGVYVVRLTSPYPSPGRRGDVKSAVTAKMVVVR